MYVLLKCNKETDLKGILIFTHNETNYLRKHFAVLKKNYFLVQHVQFGLTYSKNPMIDLHMFPPAKCENKTVISIATHVLIEKCFNANEDISTVNQNLQSLLKKYNLQFQMSNGDAKTFDFLYVGRCAALKKTADVLSYFEHAVSTFNANCCMLLLDQKGAHSSYKRQVLNRYQRLGAHIKKKLLLIDTAKLHITDNPYFFGFKLDDAALFYKTSKVYIHACQAEGGSRAIHEGLNSGCIVMAKRGMTGGGLNNLNNNNSVLYTNSNAKSAMSEALSKVMDYKPNPQIIERISVVYMEETLLKIFYDRFGYDSKLPFEQFYQVCDKGLWQLKLAAHYFKVPWYNGGLTSTITSDKSYAKFYHYLNT